MSINWVAVPGTSVVSDATKPVKLQYGPGFTTIKPDGASLTGVVHVPFPSVPHTNAHLKKVEISGTNVLAWIDELSVYNGKNMMERYTITQSPPVPLNFEIDFDEHGNTRFGWVISLDVHFQNDPAAEITIDNVYLEFEP